MNILIYNWRDIHHSWAGGGEVYIFEQASRWAKAGHTVLLFCAQDVFRRLPEYEVIQGIHVYRRGGRYSVYFWAAWYYIWRFRHTADIVIDVENGIPFFTPLFCTKPKVCYVYHIHGRQFFYELSPLLGRIGYIIEKFVFPFLYRRIPIIAISETTKRQLVGIGLPEKNISIVYSGINGHSARPAARRKFTHPTLLYLGRIKKYKRVDLLVDIFAEVAKKIPGSRLVIAGWGTEASHLTDIVMQSPLRRKISLMGPVSVREKRQLLAKSWAFVNPSIGEGWSIAVIEANMYGTPAIAFRVPGLTESIRHGKTGILVNSNDEMLTAVCKILSDGQYRTSLSNGALTWAGKFSWDASAKESLKILEKIRGRKS